MTMIRAPAAVRARGWDVIMFILLIGRIGVQTIPRTRRAPGRAGMVGGNVAANLGACYDLPMAPFGNARSGLSTPVSVPGLLHKVFSKN